MTDNNHLNFLAFSKPFIEGAQTVFETMIETKLTPGKPKIKEDSDALSDLTAVINISGDRENKPYQALLVISWPYQTYINMSSAMLQEEYTEYNKEIKDVGAEICNIITGNAKRNLNGLGYTCSMAIPTMIEGSGHKLNYPDGTTIVHFPIKSDHGEFVIEICYTESFGSAQRKSA
jgi:chemotaxis protein CheX